MFSPAVLRSSYRNASCFCSPITQVRSVHSLTTHIGERERSKIQDIFLQFSESPYDYSKFDSLSNRAEIVLREHLPSQTIRDILEVNTSNKGFVEITGMPGDPFTPNTPLREGEAEKIRTTFVKEFFCMGLANLLEKKYLITDKKVGGKLR